MRTVAERRTTDSGLEPMLDLLSGPLAAAAAIERIPLVGGAVTVPKTTRSPALLVRLLQTLDDRAVVVRGRMGGVALPPVVFAPWSGAGAQTVLRATADAVVGPMRVELEAWRVGALVDPRAAAAAITGPAMPAAEAAGMLEGVLLEGELARVLLLLADEKQRILVAAREVAASRHVGTARAGALDALGADHGVPRIEGEADDDYRARLRIFASWRIATPAGLELALNGADPAAATGLPSTVGIGSRFRIVDAEPELAVAVRVLECTADGPGRWHDTMRELARRGLLVDLDAPPVQLLPPAVIARRERVRVALVERLDRAAPLDERRYLSVRVAVGLERAVRMLDALTGSGRLELLQAHSAAEDARHDLGLSVSVRPLTPARLRELHAAATDLLGGQREPAAFAGAPAEVRAAVLGAVPRDPALDPIGAWLFEAAGLFASQPSADVVLLSGVSAEGLAIEGSATMSQRATSRLEARMRRRSAAARHVLVDEAWERLLERLPAPRRGAALTPATLRDALALLAAGGVTLPAGAGPLVGLGLAPGAVPAFAGAIAERFDLDLAIGWPIVDDDLALAPADARAAAARDRVAADLQDAVAAGFHSVRVLPDPAGAGLLALAAIATLPGGANRPDQAPPADFRWSLIDLTPEAHGQQLEPPFRLTRRGGGRVDVTAVRPGLALLVCAAHVRRAGADPYEVRIAMDEGVLTLDQYGYVMNLLEHLCPLGIEINTFDIRRDHVSIAGAAPTLLDGRVSRSYLRYRRRRPLGADRHPDAF